MSDPRYTYDKVNVIKIIIENNNGEILLIKEPDTNEWMPGHWGLPGGKTLVKESLREAFTRKMHDDLGINIEPLGLYKVEELLMESKTAMMYHAVGKLEENVEIHGEISEYKWMNEKDIKAMDLTEFTEYYNKKLLLDYFTNKNKVIPFEFVETHPYHSFSNNEEYQKWLASGTKHS